MRVSGRVAGGNGRARGRGREGGVQKTVIMMIRRAEMGLVPAIVAVGGWWNCALVWRYRGFCCEYRGYGMCIV